MSYNHLMIYLIGGAPCSGKTSLAKKLESRLNIPLLSTDTIRSWMQKLLSKNEFPALFHALDLSAKEYLTQNSPSQIITKEEAQQKIVAKGILAFIQSENEWP